MAQGGNVPSRQRTQVGIDKAGKLQADPDIDVNSFSVKEAYIEMRLYRDKLGDLNKQQARGEVRWQYKRRMPRIEMEYTRADLITMESMETDLTIPNEIDLYEQELENLLQIEREIENETKKSKRSLEFNHMFNEKQILPELGHDNQTSRKRSPDTCSAFDLDSSHSDDLVVKKFRIDNENINDVEILAEFKKTKNSSKLNENTKQIKTNLPYVDKNKLLKRLPTTGKFIRLTKSNGDRFYLRCKENVNQFEKTNWSLQNSESLLGISMHELYRKMENEKKGRFTLRDELQNIEIQNKNENPDLWAQKYAPKHYFELISSETVNRKVLFWLKSWDYVVFKKPILPKPSFNKKVEKKQDNNSKFNNEFDDKILDNNNYPLHKIALLAGNPGLGKTTLAQVLARHAGYNVIEMNASDDRTTEIFKNRIESATQMKSVLGTTARPNCLVIDEIDGAPQATINILLNFVKKSSESISKKTNKKNNVLQRPIICICNDLYTPSLRLLRQSSFVLNFPPISTDLLSNRLLEILTKEHVQSDLSSMILLCEKTENDVRSCLNSLQFLKLRKKSHILIRNIQDENIGVKDIEKGLFRILNQIFKMPINKSKMYINPHERSSTDLLSLKEAVTSTATHPSTRFESILKLVTSAGEYDKISQGLFENYLNVKFKDYNMNLIQNCLDWLIFSDITDSFIRKKQNYSLLAYQPYVSLAFHFLLASANTSKMQYPNTISEVRTKKIKHENFLKTFLLGISPSLRHYYNEYSINSDLIPLIIDILEPTMRPINSQLYNANERQELLRVIHSMIGYGLSYIQTKNLDSYVYLIEPDIYQVLFNKRICKLSYSLKQYISREINIEKMRGVQKLSDQNNDKRNTNMNIKESKKCLLSPILKPKIKEIRKHVATDFFGRKINNSHQEFSIAPQVENQIWFQFKEGYSNAVRRSVKLNDLL